MSNTDRYIFEALDYLYILGEIDDYQEVVNSFVRFTDRREPIPNDLKRKMADALRKRKANQ